MRVLESVDLSNEGSIVGKTVTELCSRCQSNFPDISDDNLGAPQECVGVESSDSLSDVEDFENQIAQAFGSNIYSNPSYDIEARHEGTLHTIFMLLF